MPLEAEVDFFFFFFFSGTVRLLETGVSRSCIIVNDPNPTVLEIVFSFCEFTFFYEI